MIVKFLVDFMLGKLTRELRLLGFDTQYINLQTDDLRNPMILLKLAQSENRIILTRNTKLKNYSGVVFINSEYINEQIAQVIKSFKLKIDIKPFSRCLVCNEILISVKKEEIKGKVPFYIFQTKDEFSCCPKCQKIYWAGTHQKNMRERVRKLIAQ
jgi:uncharacterized protein with PIN domain